jgi:hypothetical protein
VRHDGRRMAAPRLALLLAMFSVRLLAQDVLAPLPFPIRSHEEWFRMQYGASLEGWTAKLGPDYRNRNSGPACVVMLLHYKKRAWIRSDFGSCADRRFPRIHADSRWKFCRANTRKGYPGGFAEDDQAEVPAEELASVLSNEDIPTIIHAGMDRITLPRISAIISRANLAVCRVDPSVYFMDERPGEGRWVVVFGVTDTSVILHDPGREEGRSRAVPRMDFLEAVRRADGGGRPVMIECLTMVGNYGDGWHADGRSRPFIDAFRRFERLIGRPDNPGGTFLVHKAESCIVQDFVREADSPGGGGQAASILFLDPVHLKAFWLQGEFHAKYMKIWGFRELGPALSDEYPVEGGTRQDFQKGRLERKGGEVVIHVAAPPAPAAAKK